MDKFYLSQISIPDKFDDYIHYTRHHPFLSSLVAFFCLCIVTRIFTGFRANFKVSADPANSRAPPALPYWVPFIGHAIEFITNHQKWMSNNRDAYSTGIYSIRMGPSRHNVITAPSLQAQVLAPRTPVSQDGFFSYVLKHAFSDGGATKDLIDRGVLWDGPHKVLYGMMREPFLSTAVRNTVDVLQDQTFDLISGNSSWVDQYQWERAARVEVIPPDKPGATRNGQKGVVASLHPLIKHWIGNLGINILMGRAFLENNQSFMDDFWKFDDKVQLFLIGLPYWVVPTLPPAALCRERLISAVAEHHDAAIKILDNQDPGSKYDNMSDMSNIMWDRIKAYRQTGIHRRGLAAGDLGIVWAITANAAPVAFWLVYHILATPGLLAEIREEIAPYVKLKQPPETGLPFKDLPKLEIDGPSLKDKCPLLKGTLYETLRFDTSSMVYKSIDKDFVIAESELDAKIVGKSAPESYLLKKGDFACLPGGTHGFDPRYFKDPMKFDPRRFWVSSKDQNGQEVIKIDYGSLRPWGGGHTICKGRSFAEQEIMFFAAALLSCYDIEPADGKGWKPVSKRAQAGTYVPTKDIRVKMWKRTKW